MSSLIDQDCAQFTLHLFGDMGGKVFQPEGLLTPRMSHDVYYKILEQVQMKLKPLYDRIESPIEAPEKNDHGDLDVFVISTADHAPTTEEIMAVLGAKIFKTYQVMLHIAIPWPEDQYPVKSESVEDELSEIEDAMTAVNLSGATIPESDPDTINQPLYIQLDLHVYKNSDELKYALFMNNHGDLLNIIGGIIRRFGLTCSNSGLYIRISELEPFNKNYARYKIMDDPEKILKYLGLNEKRFWQPFTSWEEAMDYAATCRFHDPAKGKNYDVIDTEMMNAEDRKRLPKRTMFNYWIENYLPSHRDDPEGSSCKMSREEIIEEAKMMFGQDFTKAFDLQRSTGVRLMQEQQLWADLRKKIDAEGAQLTFATKGLKREITIVPEDESLMSDVQMDYAAGRFDKVKIWSLENWEEVGLRQERLDKDKSMQVFLSKLEKEGKLQP